MSNMTTRPNNLQQPSARNAEDSSKSNPAKNLWNARIATRSAVPLTCITISTRIQTTVSAAATQQSSSMQGKIWKRS